MTQDSEPVDTTEDHPKGPAKRPWVKPTLETFGTITDLTRGVGMTSTFDGSPVPGQNKSKL